MRHVSVWGEVPLTVLEALDTVLTCFQNADADADAISGMSAASLRLRR